MANMATMRKDAASKAISKQNKARIAAETKRTAADHPPPPDAVPGSPDTGVDLLDNEAPPQKGPPPKEDTNAADNAAHEAEVRENLAEAGRDAPMGLREAYGVNEKPWQPSARDAARSALMQQPEPDMLRDFDGEGGYKYRLYNDGRVKILGAPEGKGLGVTLSLADGQGDDPVRRDAYKAIIMEASKDGGGVPRVAYEGITPGPIPDAAPGSARAQAADRAQAGAGDVKLAESRMPGTVPEASPDQLAQDKADEEDDADINAGTRLQATQQSGKRFPG